MGVLPVSEFAAVARAPTVDPARGEEGAVAVVAAAREAGDTTERARARGRNDRHGDRGAVVLPVSEFAVTAVAPTVDPTRGEEGAVAGAVGNDGLRWGQGR